MNYMVMHHSEPDEMLVVSTSTILHFPLVEDCAVGADVLEGGQSETTNLTRAVTSIALKNIC